MTFPIDKTKRLVWATTRAYLEADNFKRKRFGGKRKSHWTLFERMVRFFSIFLKIGPLYRIGNENARNVVVNHYTLSFKNLPKMFDGYKIVHLADLHVDCIPGIENTLAEKLAELKCDLCVITGDYREKTHGGYKQILGPMRKIIGSIKSQDGILAILGNHDTYLMVDDFEKMGMRVLVNETVRINRKGERLNITGVDDPNTYYTDSALVVLEEEHPGFKILLAHSPELFDLAQKNDYQMYLTGHTHGGQISLPGGRAIVTHIKTGKKYYRGVWRINGMTGFTNQGCSASGIPVRFNTQSEIAYLTLRRKKQ
jgi:uncharacterized protein